MLRPISLVTLSPSHNRRIARDVMVARGLASLALLLAVGCGADPVTKPDTAGGADTGPEDVPSLDATSDADTGGAADTVGQDAGTCTADADCVGKVTLDNSCLAAVCEAGSCVAKQKAAGADCDDAKACTKNDKCDAKGACAGEMSCTAEVCYDPICKDDGTCAVAKTPDSAKVKCDDDNACTDDDLCGQGACAGTAFDPHTKCDDNESCTIESCDKDKGCLNTPQEKDTPCSDGDACTDPDKCDAAGKCVSGGAVVCNDQIPCTKDSCDSKTGCVFPAYQNGVSCDDSDKCTDKDECADGKCKGATVAAAQQTNPCLLVSCDKTTGKITSTAAPDGKPCSDEDGCTTNDLCSAGLCTGKALVCNDGNSCTADACDKKTGSCVSPAQADGLKCDDGDKCTQKDACVKGKCTGEGYTTTGMCDDKSPCTNDGCSPQSGCFHVPKNDVFCDDGDKCTELDKCSAGKCLGVKADCDDNKPCTNDACDPATGKCVHTTFTGPCDDGNKCTTEDLCTAGACGGKSVTCDDDNPCTTDICDTLTGCKYVPLAGGSQCDDGISCTHNDQCDLGKCVGTNSCVLCTSDLQCASLQDNNLCNGTAHCAASKLGKVCQLDLKTVVVCTPADDPACGTNQCNPTSGKCELLKKQKGVPCVSNDKCLASTVCSDSGTCEGSKKDCDDSEPCTDDSCDPKVGCKNAAKADASVCDDNNVCTAGEACKDGICSSTPAQNKCACASDSECTKFEDGDLCNGVFQCIGKLCLVGPATTVICDPSKESCTENLCVKTTGKCAVTPKKDGLVCDDGSKCTIQDTCKAGKCTTDAKLSCDDQNPCTVDACGPLAGCVHGDVGDGGQCDDGDACTETDKCAKGKCAGAKKSCDDDNPCTIDLCSGKTGKCSALLDNKLVCSDGDPCTTGDKCLDGVCKSSALTCDDNNPCTVDGCDGKGGCLNKLELGKDCDDGNACTALDHCDIQAKCAGKAKDCDDGSACTEDSCINGACVIKASVGKACDDGNKCTSADACNIKGECEAKLVDCDDGNACTKIAGPCSPVNGCTIVPDDGKNCTDGNACTYLDKCKTGSCEGTAVNCNDNNVCTVDNCDAKSGCQNKQNVCDDENDCTFDKCDNTKGCLHSNLDGFQPCDDGDACTDKGVCNKGQCEAKLKDCDDQNVCTTDKCTATTKDETGGCVNLPVEDTATKCDDGKACTTDRCDGKGKCASTALDCDDGNACTVDACISGKGCQYDDKKDGSDCDDGDVCSSASQCQGGFCIPKDKDLCVTCSSDNDCKVKDNNNLCDGKWECVKKKPTDLLGNCIEDKTVVQCDGTGDTACAKNQCNTLTGVCAVNELVNGSKCDDDLPCTVGDTCTNGQCKSAGEVDCSSVGDSCNSAACVFDATAQAGYSCVPLPKAGTIVCDADGDPCTAGDTCDDGKCKAGKPISCDGVAGECELAACVKDGSGGFTCKITGAKDGATCDDGQLCTAGDACKSGKCQAGTGPYNCSADVNVECAVGVCDKTNNGGKGGCTAQPKNNGGECNADDNGCTSNDICAQGICVPGVPPDCNAKTGACTVGACKSTGKTTFTCIGAPIKESKPCEADDNGCTLDDKCIAGACVPGKMKDCSSLDGSSGCQIGACEPLSSSQGKCVSKPASGGVPCDADGNGCTKDDVCNGKGACQPGTAVNCLKETNGCGQGTCKSISATTFKCATDAKPKGTKCDADADGCTVDDTCDGLGACVPGKAPDCTKEDKGQCIVGGCTNKGSVTYLCEAYPRKNGENCDADKDGCTVKDACQLGFCNPGVLETCKALQGECVTATCADDGGSSFKCKVTPVASWPPLTVEQICDPKAKAGEKDACATGYKCEKPDAGSPNAVCISTATVNCADGDKCVEAAMCIDGLCKAQTQKDCDDKDPCTLDACKSGTCSNTKIAGCGPCLVEGFEKPIETALLRTSGDYITLAVVQGDAATGSSVLSASWDGTKDAKATTEVVEGDFSLSLRKMYLEADASQTLTFNYKATAGTADCTEVLVNGAPAWKQCGSFAGATTKGYGLITVDLTAYAGRSVDLVVRTKMTYTKTTKGEVRIDDITLSGKCAKGCMGTALEVPVVNTTTQAKEKAIPQPWKLAAEAVNFLSWNVNDKDGHSGKASLRATWTGGSPDGKAYSASITIPEVTVLADTRLHFAVRAKTLGEVGCGGDTLSVMVNGTLVHQTCDAVQAWKVISVDLKAFSGKVVDVVLIAKSGQTKAAAGVVEIDDVAISGDCSYLCYSEPFNDGLGSLKNTSEGAASFGWAYQTTTVASKPGAAAVSFDKTTTAGATAFLTPAPEEMVFVEVPVMGASYDINVSAFVSQKIEPCFDSTDLKQTDPTTAPIVFGLTNGAVLSPQFVEKYRNILVVSALCESVSGFQKLTGVVPDVVRGTFVQPFVMASRVGKVDTAKFYVDDMRIICK